MSKEKQCRRLDEYIMAALYPTYENVERALKDNASDPNSVSGEAILAFMFAMTLPNAKTNFMCRILAKDYSFLDSYSDPDSQT